MKIKVLYKINLLFENCADAGVFAPAFLFDYGGRYKNEQRGKEACSGGDQRKVIGAE